MSKKTKKKVVAKPVAKPKEEAKIKSVTPTEAFTGETEAVVEAPTEAETPLVLEDSILSKDKDIVTKEAEPIIEKPPNEKAAMKEPEIVKIGQKQFLLVSHKTKPLLQESEVSMELKRMLSNLELGAEITIKRVE